MNNTNLFWAPVIAAMRNASTENASDAFLIAFASKRGLANPIDAANAWVAFLED